MRKKAISSLVTASVLIFGALVCHAEKWDKHDYSGGTIESGYYDAQSIKVTGNQVNWTEKYILTPEGASFVTGELSKYEGCKQNIAKKGNVTQYQLDYEIRKGEFRGVAKRYYNKAKKLVCTDKDTGKEFKYGWRQIERGSPIEQAKYDLVTKYKVKFQQ